jgi:hypothetical protein
MIIAIDAIIFMKRRGIMSRFREHKEQFQKICASPGWREALKERLIDDDTARTAANAFLALLPRPDCRWQAVYGLGLCLARLSESDMEAARVFMRRLMWSLNEESGNLGWGIPEAMGEVLATSPRLAGEYARIFLSYGYETGKDDNFLDHAPLRRGVYWGIGRLAGKNPVAALPALPHLAAALGDGDALVRLMAAWALQQLAKHLSDEAFAPGGSADAWRSALQALRTASTREKTNSASSPATSLFDGETIREARLDGTLAEAIAAVERRGITAGGVS